MDSSGDAAGRMQRAADELAVTTAMEHGEQGGGPEEDDSLSARLLNNAAALHLRSGEKHAGLQLMYEAVQVRACIHDC